MFVSGRNVGRNARVGVLVRMALSLGLLAPEEAGDTLRSKLRSGLRTCRLQFMVMPELLKQNL